jgi:hypothetical protein
MDSEKWSRLRKSWRGFELYILTNISSITESATHKASKIRFTRHYDISISCSMSSTSMPMFG